MNKEPGYTLEELAEAFDLTPRTARYYIENVLPPHHKQGRGKLAIYDQDTWNCFAFIQKARTEKLTTGQISGVLADLSQAQIDRVASGEEELTIVPMASTETRGEYVSDRMASPSRRMSRMMMSEASPHSLSASFAPESPDIDADMISEAQAVSRWQVLYSDDELQITFKGNASARQREQIRLAANLMKQILLP
jgi:DNA-binding transcriptional MerR regulator